MDENAMSEPVGASVWELNLFTYLTNHVRLEGKMLAEYTELAAGTESKAMEYLVDILIEDERRHHRFFMELASSLKAGTESKQEPAIPRMDFHKVDQVRLLEASKRLLDHERDDARELKRLRKELRDVKDTTLWGVLVDMMMSDTSKHVAVLEFVVDHVDPGRSK